MTRFLTTIQYLSHKQSTARLADDLPAPMIDEAVEGKLTRDALGNGLTFRIPTFDSMQVGDRFLVVMSSFDNNFGTVGQVTGPLGSPEAFVHVPAERCVGFANLVHGP